MIGSEPAVRCTIAWTHGRLENREQARSNCRDLLRFCISFLVVGPPSQQAVEKSCV